MGALVPTFFQFHQFSIRNTKSAIHCLVIPMADRTFSLGLNAIKKKRIGLVGLLPERTVCPSTGSGRTVVC